MENRKQATNSTEQPQIERRYTTGNVEVRAKDGGGYTIRGYAFKFGVSYDMGWFTEEIHRDALKNTDISDVRILQDHVSYLILGRTKSGTARIGIDTVGGWYENDLPESPNGQNMRVAIERGDVDQSSWGFMLRRTDKGNGDTWETRNGKQHRTITDVALWMDASPVTFPANPDTTVAKRSLEAYQKESVPPETKDNGADTQTEIELTVALLERRLDYLNLTA